MMPTESSPKPKARKETWADWLPDVEPTLTIDEVVARLHKIGLDDITIEHIRYWQKERVLPAPIRRQVGTGKGGIRALYPSQAVEAIARIRPLQETDVPLREINAHLARMFGINKPITLNTSATIRGTSSVSAHADLHIAGNNAGELVLEGNDTTFTSRDATGATIPATLSVMGHTVTAAAEADDALLFEAVTSAATRQEQRTGSPIRKVEVIFTDLDGRKHFHVFPLLTE